MTDAELRELLDFCMEGRKRVKDQLYIIDETFKSEPVDFSYTVLPTGEVVKPETLENQNYAAAPVSKPRHPPGSSQQAGRVTFLNLQPHQTILKDNQTGVSYRALFADYLKGANSITVQDPTSGCPTNSGTCWSSA